MKSWKLFWQSKLSRSFLQFPQQLFKKYKYLILSSLFLSTVACGGRSLPSVTYSLFPTSPQYPSSSVTGIRGITHSPDVFVTGGYFTDVSNCLLYQGPLFQGGVFYVFTPPSTLSPDNTISSCNLYGPDNGVVAGETRLVGTYKISGSNETFGFFYSGSPTGVGGTWLNIAPSSLVTMGDNLSGTVPHSNMNGIIVGNFTSAFVVGGRAFIYNTANSTYYELIKPNAVSITAYGIWWNGGTSYTIVGGYIDLADTEKEIGYIVDWDSSTQVTSNWTSLNFQNNSQYFTHFEGIDGSSGPGLYTLAATWGLPNSLPSAGFGGIPRNSDGSFGTATWIPVSYPGASTTTANTVYLNNLLGVFQMSGSATTTPYIATISNL